MGSEKVMMGLDIGSNWVRAVIGSLSKDGQVMIDSICERQSEGVKNGIVVNLEQTYKVIASVIQEAELQAGAEVQSFITGVGGSSVEGRQSEGVIGINTKGFQITKADILRSLEIARTFNLSPDRVILHTLVQDFTVDSRGGIKDPIDMTGHRLESRALVVTASSANCNNAKKVIQKVGIPNPRIVLSQLADAEVVLSTDEREMGTILINIGANTSDMIVYQNGAPSYVGGVDIGGSSVTGDIAYLLNKPKQIAEQIKCEYGCCYIPSVDPEEKILIPQLGNLPSISIPKKELSKIIEPRMAEIFSLLKKDLEEKQVRGSFGGGVVLVGGGSLLSGITDLASEIFRMQARIGFPEALAGLDRSYINPKYATVLGLLKTEAKKMSGSIDGRSRGRHSSSSERTGLFRKIGNFFRTVV